MLGENNRTKSRGGNRIIDALMVVALMLLLMLAMTPMMLVLEGQGRL